MGQPLYLRFFVEILPPEHMLRGFSYPFYYSSKVVVGVDAGPSHKRNGDNSPSYHDIEEDKYDEHKFGDPGYRSSGLSTYR